MDLSIIIENISLYIDGFFITIQLTGLSLVIGLGMSIPLAIIRTSKNFFLSGPVRLFVYIFRGTPLLIQMFIIYYGFGQFDALKETIFWEFFKNAYLCALLAFTLNTCAYTIEIIRGAIDSMPFGEMEAAKSVPSSTWATAASQTDMKNLLWELGEFSKHSIQICQ